MLDWIGDTVDSVFSAAGDAFSWVGDQVKDILDSKIGRVAIIVAVAYFAFVAIAAESVAATAVETSVAAETGVAAAGSAEMTAASAGAQLGAEGAVAAGAAEGGAVIAGAEGVGAGTGVLEAAEAAATIEGVAAGASGGAAGIGTGAAEVGALEATSWAAQNPMLAYGGMMAGGQAVSGYMQGEQIKDMEEQRLKEEQEARDRQNIWGVNYGTGGESISAGDRLKDLNRDYFDSSAPINPAVQDYQLASARNRAGVLDEITGTANPEQYAHKPGAV